MKLDLSKAVVTYYSEGRTSCLGVAMKTGNNYTLYKPVDQKLTDWDKVTSSKTPSGFSDIVFGGQAKFKPKSELEEKITKNNNMKDTVDSAAAMKKEEPKKTGSKTVTNVSTKKVKKSFL